MKKFIIAGLITLSSTVAYAALPAVLAKVNGKEITREEIEKAFAQITMDQPGQKKLTFDRTPVDFQKAFVEKYAEKMLIIEAGKKANLQNDPEIKQKLKEAEEFLIQQKFMTDIVMKKKTDEGLKKIYDEKFKNREGKEEVHAYHILVKSEDEAKKISKQLKDGADFDKLAKLKSTEPGAKVSGGDLGYFTAEQMVPEFSKAAFAMKKGEISDPVQTNFGWHVIKVVDKRAKKIPSFAEVKPALEKQLATDMVEDEVKRLKVAADIEYFGALKTVPKAETQTKALVKKVDEKKTEDVKPTEKKSEEKKTEEVKPAEKKPEEKKAEEVKPVEKKAEEKKPEEKKAEEKKPEDKPAAVVTPVEEKKETKKVEEKKPEEKPAEVKPVEAKAKKSNEKVEEETEEKEIIFEEKFEDGTSKVKGKAQ